MRFIREARGVSVFTHVARSEVFEDLMREIISSVAVGALFLALACSSSVTVVDGAGGRRSSTSGVGTSEDGEASSSALAVATGVGGATSSAASTGMGGASMSVSSSVVVGASTAVSSSSSSSVGTGTTDASSSASTGGGGTGGGTCAQASLVGINWTGTEWQTARLDPVTGNLTVLAALSVPAGFAQGFSAYDPITKHVYEFGGDSRVYTIDGVTGALLGSALSESNVYNPKVNGTGQIVVLHYNGTAAETATLDPTTGALSSLAPLPYSSFGQAECAVDSKTNRIYQFGPNIVLTIDGTTGAMLAVATPTQEFDSAIVNDAGALIGIDYPAQAIGRMDPTTGAITSLAPFSYGVAQGIRTYDPCSNRIYLFADSTLYTVDGTTGALLSTVTMPQQNFTNVEAVW